MKFESKKLSHNEAPDYYYRELKLPHEPRGVDERSGTVHEDENANGLTITFVPDNHEYVEIVDVYTGQHARIEW